MDIVVLKILGIGTAFAVLVDSVLVGCLLLPAALRLLGGRAWWLPSHARLHGRIGLHEAVEATSAPRFPSPRSAD